jgi:uncharacterized membrane protein YGL010W
MPVVKFPFRKQLAYTSGMIGWSMMTNTIIVMLPYFYLPPSNSGLTPFVPQLLLFGVLISYRLLRHRAGLLMLFTIRLLHRLAIKALTNKGGAYRL